MSMQYIGSGKLYLKKAGAADFTEVGLIQNISMNVSINKTKLMDYSTGLGVTAAEVITERDYSLAFETADVNPDNLAIGFFGSVSTLSAVSLPASGEEGYIAGATEIKKIIANAETTQWTGEIKIELNPALENGGVVNTGVLYCPNATLSLDGDIALVGPDFRKLRFTANLQNDANGQPFRFYVKTA